jgi:hypothetical protein
MTTVFSFWVKGKFSPLAQRERGRAQLGALEKVGEIMKQSEVKQNVRRNLCCLFSFLCLSSIVSFKT